MGRDKRKEYPEWIQKHITEGTTVKEIRGKYYLYRRGTSKRVEGKKNPQPVYEYLGTITADGLKPPEKKRIDITDIKVREYGFSYALLRCCPESWKAVQGERWKDKLAAVIASRSRNTFLHDQYEHIMTFAELRVQPGTMASSLGRKLVDSYKVTLEELQTLDTIYLVTMGENQVISCIDEEQQEVLNRVGVALEVR